jgi:hypothetical protein
LSGQFVVWRVSQTLKGIDARFTELGKKRKQNSQGTHFVVHEVYEIFHSVIFLKLKVGAITFFVSFIFDVNYRKLHI